jgi:hypothetical protein
VCVECGHDLSGAYRKPAGSRVWLVAGVVAVIAIGVGAGFAVGALTSDKKDKNERQARATVPPAVPTLPPATTTPTVPTTPTTPTTPTSPTTPTTPTTGSPTSPTTPTVPTLPTTPGGGPPPGGSGGTPKPNTGSGGLASWPDGKTAYTVVLVSTKRKAQAKAKAREAKSSGIPAGILNSSDYSSLNPGYWVVFAGQYKTVGAARSKAGDYQSQGFPQAYPRQVKK